MITNYIINPKTKKRRERLGEYTLMMEGSGDKEWQWCRRKKKQKREMQQSTKLLFVLFGFVRFNYEMRGMAWRMGQFLVKGKWKGKRFRVSSLTGLPFSFLGLAFVKWLPFFCLCYFLFFLFGFQWLLNHWCGEVQLFG